MKFPKVNLSNVVEMALSLGLVGAVSITGFYILQHFFSFFSYQNMSREEVLKTVKELEKHYPLLSRACGENFCRGIYLTQGGLLYYRLEDDDRHTSYNLYQVPSELYTTVPSFIPYRWSGKVSQIGSS